jgi:hypothetical protein
MADQIRFDPTRPVKVEIRAVTLTIFQFRAQFRVPGSDFIDFGSGGDDDNVSESLFRTILPATHQSFTDLRVTFLVSGKAKRPYRILVGLSQDGRSLADPLVCDGEINSNEEMVLDKVEALLV